MTIAIDFGTTNTVIARWNAATEQPEVVSLPGLSRQDSSNPPVVPSLVYVEDAQVGAIAAGQQVRDRGLDLKGDSRFFQSFKRGIGSEVQGFLPQLDNRSIRFEKVGEWFLQHLLLAVTQVPLPLDSLILTVPVDSFETYRHWLGSVVESPQLPQKIEQVRLLDEPTAAALGYGVAAADLLLVIDFGGGTLDISLVELGRRVTPDRNPLGFILKWGDKSFRKDSGQKLETAKVIAKSGQNLGGADVDNWLLDTFASGQGLPKTSLTQRLVEKLKIELSSRPQASEVYFNEETFESYELNLSRSEFEEILQQQQFFKRLDESLTQVLQQARRQGLESPDIDAVVLVGGTSQIPAVQDWLKDWFPSEKIRCDRPLDAIATGALQLTQGIQLKDFLYHGYGVRYWNRRKNAHDWHPIIQPGQPYPLERPIELSLGASIPEQPKLELVLGEMGAEAAKTEVFFDGDRLITRQANQDTTVIPLNDSDQGRTIANLDPPGSPGSDRVKIQFRIDAERFLRITVDDLLTSERLIDNQVVVQLS
ncbi:Hsp70 family protein [Sodalinema gerasimenkoae]|uniref:Hsp70 family protein n=1 Tax=Sodalinema gerasimenkoae TaxID=2862348 RepID=UPI0013579C28|nr:Hsp70 family protein [Sodalinema gerasimenkoae]